MRQLVVGVGLALVLAACDGGAAPSADPLAGDYVAAASESAVPIADRLTAVFAARHPGMRWTVKGVGAGAAVALVAAGEADAGFISRDLTVQDLQQAQASMHIGSAVVGAELFADTMYVGKLKGVGTVWQYTRGIGPEDERDRPPRSAEIIPRARGDRAMACSIVSPSGVETASGR